MGRNSEARRRARAIAYQERRSSQVILTGMGTGGTRRERREQSERLALRPVITPEALVAGKAALRKVKVVPAMPGYDRISLLRKGQSAHRFTDFMVEARRSLHTLNREKLGAGLLSALDRGTRVSPRDHHSTVLIADARARTKKRNTAKAEQSGAARALRDDPGSRAGRGSSTLVHFNPDKGRGNGRPRPAFIGLAHELVHALRNQHGLSVAHAGLPRRLKALGRKRNELETVGLLKGPRAIRNFTENTIRAAFGIERRPDYSGTTKRAYKAAVKRQLRRERDGR